MQFKALLRICIRQYARGTQLLVHGLYLRGECLPEVDPQRGLLPVEHIRAGRRLVDVLQFIREYQGALIVRADCSVIVIWQDKPLAPIIYGRERILRTVIHHQEQFREYVIENDRVHFHMACQFRLELCQPVRRRVCGVGCPIIGYRSRQCLPGCRVLVSGHNPCRKGSKIFRVPVPVWVTPLKVVEPFRPVKISRLEKHPVRSVVLDFPGFIPSGKPEHFLCPFVVVEVVFSNKRRILPVIPENNDGEPVNPLPDMWVFHLRRRFVWAGIIV